MLTAAWSIVLAVAGGVDLTIGGVRVTSHDAYRPLLVSAGFLIVYAMLRRAFRPSGRSPNATGHRFDWIRRPAGVPGPLGVAWTLAAVVVVVAWLYGAKAVVGADSYGYLSQSDLWAEGSLKIRQPFVAEVPWPDAGWMFAKVRIREPIEGFRI